MNHAKNTPTFSISNIVARTHQVMLPLLGIFLLPSCSSVDDPVVSTNTVNTVMASNNTPSSQAPDPVVWKADTATTPVEHKVKAPDTNSSVVSTKPVAKPVTTPVTKPVTTPVTKPVATKPVVTKPVVTKPVATKPVVTKPVAKPEEFSLMPVLTKPATKPVITKPSTKPVITKPVAMPVAKRAPYDLPVFQAALDDSKLQAPNSSALVKRGKLPGFSHDCFYLNEADQMVFVTDHSSVRSELRQMEEWFTGSTKPKEMEGRVILDAPTKHTSDNYTFMQIHDSLDVPNAPLIRVEWRRDYRGEYDHIWATIRTQITPKKYLKVDLGARPDRAFTAKISVVNNQLSVSIDNQTLIKAQDVSHWDGLSSYYKAGAYSKSSGTSKVAFESLVYRY